MVVGRPAGGDGSGGRCMEIVHLFTRQFFYFVFGYYYYVVSIVNGNGNDSDAINVTVSRFSLSFIINAHRPVMRCTTNAGYHVFLSR